MRAEEQLTVIPLMLIETEPNVNCEQCLRYIRLTSQVKDGVQCRCDKHSSNLQIKSRQQLFQSGHKVEVTFLS